MKKRWLMGGGVFSIALNLFLAGAVGSLVFRVGPPPRGDWYQGQEELDGQSRHNRFVEHLTQRMSVEDAMTIRKIFDEAKPTFDANREKENEAKKLITEALHAEPFDLAALSAALDKGRDAGAAMFRDMTRVILQAATELSPDGRKVLVPPLPGRPPEHPPGPPNDQRGDRPF